MIEVNNASIGFDTPQGFKTVVHAVSLQVPQGKAWARMSDHLPLIGDFAW